MSRDPELPIAEDLRASGISLSYADWADVHAGRYERVADRVLRQARWMARVAIVGRGVLVILLVYDLVCRPHAFPPARHLGLTERM
jgi:hypothetical protein